MPVCEKCGGFFPHRVEIDNKKRVLSSRKYCLECSPFGGHNTTYPKDTRMCLFCGKLLNSRQEKYCSNGCQQAHQNSILYAKYELTGEFSKTTNNPTIRNYLIYKYGNKCAICGIESWNNSPLVFTVDHIDGRHSNYKVDNYRLVCPNCDSQLPTYKGGNKGNGRLNRRQRYKSGE